VLLVNINLMLIAEIAKNVKQIHSQTRESNLLVKFVQLDTVPQMQQHKHFVQNVMLDIVAQKAKIVKSVPRDFIVKMLVFQTLVLHVPQDTIQM
tara:strand:+ start:711 stop:992 length:282 start_codon:yes stop_codon:yes gene_type:complete